MGREASASLPIHTHPAERGEGPTERRLPGDACSVPGQLGDISVHACPPPRGRNRTDRVVGRIK